MSAELGRIADALERIAAWLESVQLTDLIEPGEHDDEPTNPEDWANYVADGLAEAAAPEPTREQRERAEAEEAWGRVEIGDELLVEWGDGYVGSIAKVDDHRPLHPQVARIRSRAR